jgi:hypothetical protein
MIRHAIRRIGCLLGLHRYVRPERLSSVTMKIHCETCNRAFAVHMELRSVLPWDSEFEALYSPGGTLYFPEYRQ